MQEADVVALQTSVAWAAFALAFALGAVMNRTGFCTMGALSDIVNMGDWIRMRMWLCAIGVAILGTQALALAGLISVFGLQAIINMAVNLSLMPAKGMTLPFISYGGSSLLSMAFAMGLVLVFGRRRPRTELSSPIVGGQLG